MQLLKKDQGLIEETWVHCTDLEPLPVSENIIVGYGRWLNEQETLLKRNGLLGLELPNDVSPADISDKLDHLSLILLDFPAFNDGRAYSQAQLLRNRYGFKGELRASGHVLRDQLAFMARCGIDCFELPLHAPAQEWSKAFSDFSNMYQGAADGFATIAQKRHLDQTGAE